MPYTQAQIDAADSITLDRISTNLQNTAENRWVAEQPTRDAADLRSKEMLTAVKSQAVIAARVVTLLEQQSALLLTPGQEVFMSMYAMHLKTRLGPSVINSSTLDTVLDDMVKDAVRMTQVAYPLVQAELNKLVTPISVA